MSSQPLNAGAVSRDRSFGLVVFGVVEILIGGFCGLLVPLSFLAWWLSGGSAGGSMTLRSILPVCLVYMVLAALLIWLGIGSIRARRWACVLMLSISRIWLLTGACTLAITWFILPGLVRSFSIGAGVPPLALTVATTVTLAMVSLIYVVLPGAFVLFYRSPDVIATCRARDPRPQFIDDCPPRVLTLAVVWGLAAISVLVMPAYDWAFPFFGTIRVGGDGALPWLVVLAGCGVLAWGTFLRRPWAWWGGVAATALAAVATVQTSVRMSPESILRTMHLGEDQLRVVESISWPERWVIALVWVAVWGSMVAYLIVVRRDFVTDDRGRR